MMKAILFLSLMSLCLSMKSLQSITEDQPDEFTVRARQHLISSWSAGCKEAELRNWTCYWCQFPGALKTNVTHYFDGEENSIFGFGGYTDDHIVFSFRGTHGVSNIMQDLKFYRTEFFNEQIPGALVHSGFLQAYMSLKDEIMSAALELSKKFPDYPVLVTGHSLGGAIATLAAVEFALNETINNSVRLWTYGCPRVGNKQFAGYVNSKYINASRVTWARDPIPHLPPTIVGYEHYNTEYWYNSPTEYKKCLKTEDPSCIDSVWVSSPWDHAQYLGIDSTLAHPFGCGGLF